MPCYQTDQKTQFSSVSLVSFHLTGTILPFPYTARFAPDTSTGGEKWKKKTNKKNQNMIKTKQYNGYLWRWGSMQLGSNTLASKVRYFLTLNNLIMFFYIVTMILILLCMYDTFHNLRKSLSFDINKLAVMLTKLLFEGAFSTL